MDDTLRSTILDFLHECSSDFSFPELSIAILDEEVELPVYFENGTISGSRKLFKTGSITKLITALAILKLREEGLLNLKDPICNHLHFIESSSQVTMIDLLLHTANLPRGRLYTDTPSEQTITDELKKAKTVEEGGRAYKYSNLGYILLGKIVESSSKTPFPKYISEKIFNPLQMADSGFGTHLPNQMMTKPHGLVSFSKICVTPFDHIEIPLGNAPAASFDMYTTAQDFAKVLRCIVNGGIHNGQQVIRKESIDLFFSNQFYIGGGISSGMGFLSVKANNDHVDFQFGEHWGHSSAFLLNKNRKTGLVAMTNRSGAGAELLFMLQTISKCINNGTKIKQILNVDNYPDLCGDYITFAGATITIGNRDGILMLSYNAELAQKITYKGQNQFIIRGGRLGKYIIAPDIVNKEVIALKIGPFKFLRSGTLAVDTQPRYEEVNNIYYNKRSGRIALFERNRELILAYSPLKEAILKDVGNNMFVQLTGPFIDETIEIDQQKGELLTGGLLFKRTSVEY